jgi:hypothetical protein
MVDKTKPELQETIKELRAKLKEMKSIEEVVTATAKELTDFALGVHKGVDGKFNIVHIRYDVEKNAAVIEKLDALGTHDFSIAAYKARQELAERVLRKAKGDKYTE